MKRAFVCTFIAVAAALAVAAEKKKAAPANPDKAAGAGAAVNRAKQDERDRELIKATGDAFEKALKENDAATAEIERFRKTAAGIAGEDSKKEALKQLKNSLDKNKLKELAEPLKEEIKARRGEPGPESEKTPESPPPASFDNVPAPAPLLKAPAIPAGATLRSEYTYLGPTHDPRRPDIVLPESDLRTRMVLMRGGVRLRKPMVVLDADEVDVILTKRQGNSLFGGDTEDAGEKAVDPVHPGSVQDSAFERIIARGRVRVMFVDATGMLKTARGGVMIYDAKSGVLLIKGWPEAEYMSTLLRGISADAFIELSNLTAEVPDSHTRGVDIFEVQRPLTTGDIPRTPEKEVPAASPVRPRRNGTTAPAPR